MRAIIVANGSLEQSERHDWVTPDDLIIAADGGAEVARELGLKPQVAVGDLDSLSSEVRAWLEGIGCQFMEHPARKDETDTELAIQYALHEGADEIVLLGAVGDRLDHTLANVGLLAMPELAEVRARIVSGATEVWLVRDELTIDGQPGDLVSLLPLGQDALGVSTEGLEYALHDDTLRFGPARGVSNVMTSWRARVTLRSGLLLALRVAQSETPGEMPELVEVYVAQGHMRASVIKSKLEASGIPALLSYDAASRIYGITVDGIGQVRVMVPKAYAEEAHTILAEEEPLEE